MYLGLHIQIETTKYVLYSSHKTIERARDAHKQAVGIETIYVCVCVCPIILSVSHA